MRVRVLCCAVAVRSVLRSATNICSGATNICCGATNIWSFTPELFHSLFELLRVLLRAHVLGQVQHSSGEGRGVLCQRFSLRFCSRREAQQKRESAKKNIFFFRMRMGMSGRDEGECEDEDEGGGQTR